MEAQLRCRFTVEARLQYRFTVKARLRCRFTVKARIMVTITLLLTERAVIFPVFVITVVMTNKHKYNCLMSVKVMRPYLHL